MLVIVWKQISVQKLAIFILANFEFTMSRTVWKLYSGSKSRRSMKYHRYLKNNFTLLPRHTAQNEISIVKVNRVIVDLLLFLKEWMCFSEEPKWRLFGSPSIDASKFQRGLENKPTFLCPYESEWFCVVAKIQSRELIAKYFLNFVLCRNCGL